MRVLTGWRNASKLTLLASVVVIGLLGLQTPRAAGAEGDSVPAKVKSAEVVTTLWAAVPGGASAQLLTQGAGVAVETSVDARTQFVSLCHDCGQPMKFKSSESAKTCSVCPCAVTAAECTVWKHLKTSSWSEMLQALPQGTGLKVLYNTDGKPESGTKVMNIDRRIVLFAVDGQGTLDDANLLVLAKKVGATKAGFAAGGKQILMSLSAEWTTDKASKFVALLGKAGVKSAFPARI